jgi:hypothetical protein
MNWFFTWFRERIRKDLEIIRARKPDEGRPYSWEKLRSKSDPGNMALDGVRGPANLWGASPGPAYDVRTLFESCDRR